MQTPNEPATKPDHQDAHRSIGAAISHAAPAPLNLKEEARRRLAATTSKEEAERRKALWALPILCDEEIAEVLGLPVSTWRLLKRQGDKPALFMLGRRIYAQTADVKAWLQAKGLK